jgi:hypothetical protein
MMVFLFWITLAAPAPPGPPPVDSPSYLNCQLVPGWEQSGPRRDYRPDNLFDYRDGAAEGYLIFGFARMQGIDCRSGASTVAIDVSEMGDADLAYGMFSANRDANQPIAGIGMGAQVLPRSVLFAKGKYFVEIVETEGDDSSQSSGAPKTFAAKMEPLLPGRDSPPSALQWFPPENQLSVRLVPESVLGLKILRRGYVAQYQRGQAFVVVEDSAQAASETMKKLRQRFEGGSPAHIGDEAFTVNAPYLQGVCVFRKGQYLGGYSNLPDAAETAAKAAKLLDRLP